MLKSINDLCVMYLVYMKLLCRLIYTVNTIPTQFLRGDRPEPLGEDGGFASSPLPMILSLVPLQVMNCWRLVDGQDVPLDPQASKEQDEPAIVTIVQTIN